jgi:predicted proteasome-type protease
VFITPINYNESKVFHLLIVTANSLRVYITFALRKDDESDDMIKDRFTSNWRIEEIMSFPSQEAGSDLTP